MSGLRFNPVVIPDAATYTLKDYNSGLLHIIPDLTATCTVTPPDPEDGLVYEFWYGGAAADAQNLVIDTGTNTVFFVGGVAWLTDGTPDIEVVYSDGNSNSKLTIVTPEAGSWFKMHCDGAKWYLNGQIVSASTPTIADQA